MSQQTAGFSSQVDDLKEQHTHVRGRVAALEDQTAMVMYTPTNRYTNPVKFVAPEPRMCAE